MSAGRSSTTTPVASHTLTVRFRKNADGIAVLTCIREDGSATWQRQHGASARFFPRHDLTHYAVETVLEVRNGFFGLVAGGWEITDFGTPWPRGPLPDGADLVEVIVGLLDLERASGESYRAEDYCTRVAEHCGARGTAVAVGVTDAQLEAIRSLRDQLFARLDATNPGDALELRFIYAEGRE